MPSIYFPADNNIVTLVQYIQRERHPEQIKARVEIGVLMALSGRETQPALKEHGQAVEGTIKIIAPKDRVSKKFDVEMILDGDEWKTNNHHHQIGLIDHLLARLELRKPKIKKKKKQHHQGTDEEQAQVAEEEFVTDDGGRPMLRMRKSDIYVGVGFRDVIERNGRFAPEFRAIEKASIVAEAACLVAETPAPAITEAAPALTA